MTKLFNDREWVITEILDFKKLEIVRMCILSLGGVSNSSSGQYPYIGKSYNSNSTCGWRWTPIEINNKPVKHVTFEEFIEEVKKILNYELSNSTNEPQIST